MLSTTTTTTNLTNGNSASPTTNGLGNIRSKPARSSWNVQASSGALNTTNPIREIIETMNLAENPNKKVIPLSIGDPTIFGNLNPSQEVTESLERANLSGKFYGYQTAAGMESAREAVAEYHSKQTGNNQVKKQDVILVSGCSHAIDLCICVLAHKGQNILIPRPGFPLYKTLTSVYGIQYKQYDLLADDNWSIDLAHLESLIDDKTAAIIVNNPSNPCGSVFSRKHLLEILELAETYKIPIIADEIYDKFVFSEKFYPTNNNNNNNNSTKHATNSIQSNFGETFHKLHDKNLENCSPENAKANLDEEFVEIDENELDCHLTNHLEKELTNLSGNTYQPFIALSSLSKTVPILTCGGISKTCLIPGLRLGWIIINDKQKVFELSVRNGLNRLTQRLMGPNSLVQGALRDILFKVPQSFYSQTMDYIYKNAKLVYDRLLLVKGLRPYMPQGSMYFMVHFEEKAFPAINGDLDFVSKLMNEESVLVLPGKCFDFPNYFRLCLTVPSNVMEEALDRMGDFCQRYYVPIEAQQQTTTTTTDMIRSNGSKLESSINGKQPTTNGNNTFHYVSKQKELSANRQQSNKCK